MGAKGSKNAEKESQVELTGSVIVKAFAEGSKSEHEAVCLQTIEGTFVLRRVGGNPFNDEVLRGLVGKRITSHGKIKGPYFMMTHFKEKSD
jgi:hypothetical protein